MSTAVFKKLCDDAILPLVFHGQDVGYDLYSIEELSIPPNSTAKLSTGISILTSSLYYPQLFGRSSIAAQNVHLSGGVIDPGYTGEIFVLLFNNSSTNSFHISKGMGIAQVVFLRMPALAGISYDHDQAKLILTDDCHTHQHPSTRGCDGFGSTDH